METSAGGWGDAMNDPFCLTCVWWAGTEADVMAQRMARCEKHRVPAYADDTCDQFAEVRTAKPMEHVSTIVARVMKDLEKGEAA